MYRWEQHNKILRENFIVAVNRNRIYEVYHNLKKNNNLQSGVIESNNETV
jgi:hypothetical protein